MKAGRIASHNTEPQEQMRLPHLLMMLSELKNMPAIPWLDTTDNGVSPRGSDNPLTVKQFYLVPDSPEALRIVLVRIKLA